MKVGGIDLNTVGYKKIGTKQNIKKAQRSKKAQAYLMILPLIIGFCVFTAYPIFWVFRYSLYDYDGVNATFIGLQNFVRAFTNDIAFWKSILNTFIIAFGKLIVEIPLSLICALFLSNSLIKYKKIYSLAFYLPKITGVSVNCMIFALLFSTYNGAVNNGLMSLGILSEPLNWFGSKWSGMAVIMLESIWAGFAVNVFYFMSGVQNIPEEVLEAAEVDGANKFQSFFKITLPLLAPVVRVIFMLAMVNSMKIMNEVLILTDGGPAGETDVVMLRIYKMFFAPEMTPQYGYASALGVITTFVIGAITILYLKISKKANTVY